MYDELIERLRVNGKLFQKYIPNAEGEILLQAADAIEELSRENESLAKSVNEASEILRKRWIPVTERLPKFGQKVLVLAYGHDVLTARLTNRLENGYPVFECNGIYLEMAKQERITHWMPLPEPPKEESYGV